MEIIKLEINDIEVHENYPKLVLPEAIRAYLACYLKYGQISPVVVVKSLHVGKYFLLENLIHLESVKTIGEASCLCTVIEPKEDILELLLSYGFVETLIDFVNHSLIATEVYELNNDKLPPRFKSNIKKIEQLKKLATFDWKSLEKKRKKEDPEQQSLF